jgi:predicted KAP-like P-loop ATPase
MWSDNETNIDLLGFQHLANAVISIVRKEHLLPATIGVYGDWGGGKSSLVQIIQAGLENEEGVVVLSFNGWLFEGYEDAKTALMGSILEELLDKQKILPNLRDKAKKLLKRVDGLKVAGGVTKLAVGLATGGFPIAFAGGFDLMAQAKGALTHLKDADPERAKEYLKEGANDGDGEEDESLRRSIREFRDDFSKLLEESKIMKLVVVIDDLDRCLPDTIIETLEAIKLFLFVKNTAFILGADERLVRYAVRKRFPELPGERVEVGRDYLEKLVQFPVRVPPLGRAEMETYISLLFTQLSDLKPEQRERARQRAINPDAGSLTSVNFNLNIAQELLKDELPSQLKEQLSLAQRIAPLLSASLKGNPRQCKRFLNTLLMRLEMAQFRNVPLQQRVLAKLMLLEYFKPESFRRLAELQAEQEGKPQQLTLMEKEALKSLDQDANEDSAPEGLKSQAHDIDSSSSQAKRRKSASKERVSDSSNRQQELDNEFKSWLNQNWTREWLELEPALSGTDLRPYFFFSRDNLLAPLGGETQRMSPLAQEIFADLLSESQAMQGTALKKAGELSVADAVAVFEGLSQRAQLEEEYGPENRAFMRLFELAEIRKELRGELITLLRRLPENAFSALVVPKLITLGQGNELENAVYDLIEKWSNSVTNRTLAQAAKGRLQRRNS